MRRVLRRMQVCRITSLEEYGKYVRDTPEEANELFGDLLISVTQFFRDEAAFDILASKAIAPLLDAVEEDGIRVWSVGCATGEEAYSLAIVMLEQAERLRDGAGGAVSALYRSRCQRRAPAPIFR